MSDIKERITVEGNFKEQVQAFVNGLIKARMEFKNLIIGVSTGSKNINQTMTLAQRKIDKCASEFIKQGETVENAIKKATDKVEKYQAKSVDRLAKKYIKLGNTIQEAYKKAQKEVNVKWNGNETTSGSDIKSSVTQFFGGKLGKGLTVLTAISAAVKAIVKTFKLANSISSQTLGVLNKFTGNIISPQGLKSAFNEAMDYETIRSNIEVLSQNVKNADPSKIFKNATEIAVETKFSEKEMVSNAEWMLKAGINPTERVQRALANTASLRPDLGGDHAGFAVYDALNGKISSLKMNYGITNEKLHDFYKTLKGQDKKDTDKALKKKNGEYVIKDPEEWINLYSLYIEKYYDKLAIEQSRTLAGLVDTMGGQFSQIASTLVGYNVEKQEPDPGSMYDVIKKALGGYDEDGNATGFIKWIDELPEQDYFKDFQGNLGNLADTAIKCIKNLNDAGLIENLFEMAGSFAEEVSKFLKELQDNGTLDKLAKDFPKLLKASLDYELAKLNVLTKMEPLIPIATGFLNILTDIINFISGEDKHLGEHGNKLLDFAALTLPAGMGQNLKLAVKGVELSRDAWDYFNSDDKETKTKTYSDADVESLINANKNITSKQKETVKETIEKDGINNYTININGNASDNEIVRKLIDEIERLQKNR